MNMGQLVEPRLCSSRGGERQPDPGVEGVERVRLFAFGVGSISVPRISLAPPRHPPLRGAYCRTASEADDGTRSSPRVPRILGAVPGLSKLGTRTDRRTLRCFKARRAVYPARSRAEGACGRPHGETRREYPCFLRRAFCVASRRPLYRSCSAVFCIRRPFSGSRFECSPRARTRVQRPTRPHPSAEPRPGARHCALA